MCAPQTMQLNSSNAIGPDGTANNAMSGDSFSKEMLQMHRSNSESFGISCSGDSVFYTQVRRSQHRTQGGGRKATST